MAFGEKPLVAELKQIVRATSKDETFKVSHSALISRAPVKLACDL